MIKTMNGNFSKEAISHLMDHSLPDISFPKKSTVRDATDDDLNQGDDAEISIFDARKYFNETGVNEAKVSKRVSPFNVISLEGISEPSDLLAVRRFSSASSFDGFPRNYRARSFNATPTASSKASWNSQTGLLSNPPGAIAVSMRNLTSDQGKKGGPATASKWLLGRKCPCSGKKSVQVEENLSVLASESKTPRHLYTKKQTHKSMEISMDTSNWSESREVISKSATYRISAENRFPNLGLGHRIFASGRAYSDSTTGFTFPILKQNTPPYLDPPPESLEILQPSDETSVSRKSTELKNQTKLVSRQSFTFPASPSRARITEDDVASDASSDLFEIESFSTQSTLYPMHHRRDSMDEASSFDARRLTATNINGGLMYNCRRSLDEPMTPSILTTECYEPSEASIDWSVTTAEGFDKGSVTNYSVAASEIDDTAMVRQENGGSSSGGSGKKKIGNGLLTCRCEKAVNVGPNPVKCVPEVQRMGQHNAYMHVSSRAQNVNKPPLARSQSYRLPLPFAT